MESISSQQRETIIDILQNIKESIQNMRQWNKSYTCSDDYLLSPDGMKTLAANCMMIEAIGEGVKNIDRRSEGKLLLLRPEIPWNQVKKMRDYIAHGYFDININFVWDVITNDLEPLEKAVDYFINELS